MSNYDDKKRYFFIINGKPDFAEFFCIIDIEEWMEGDTIASVNFSAIDRDTGLDATSTVLDLVKSTYTSDRYLKPFIKGGDEGAKYRVQIQVTTNSDAKEEFYIDFTIKSG